MTSTPLNRPFERLAATLQSRYAALLLILLLMLLIYSFVDAYKIVRWILDLAAVVLLASALRAVSGNRGAFFPALVLGLISILAGAAGGSFAVEWAYPCGAGFRALFLGFLVVTIFSDITRRESITMDAVFGACCVYLMLGLAWGSLYSLVEWIDPSSFGNHDRAPLVDASSGGRTSEAELVYFSMITMTTVGYGDIAPQAAPARTLAALEALMAQLFIAIVIARFVALEIISRSRGQS